MTVRTYGRSAWVHGHLMVRIHNIIHSENGAVCKIYFTISLNCVGIAELLTYVIWRSGRKIAAPKYIFDSVGLLNANFNSQKEILWATAWNQFRWKYLMFWIRHLKFTLSTYVFKSFFAQLRYEMQKSQNGKPRHPQHNLKNKTKNRCRGSTEKLLLNWRINRILEFGRKHKWFWINFDYKFGRRWRCALTFLFAAIEKHKL